MNNMKKIGYSALAGSLVAFSANAVELSVSGKTEITYTGKADSVNGNKWGNGNAITFSGSGDVNGMTATYTAVIQDGGQANSNTSETFASSSLMLDMGDMGTIGFDQGVGEFGVSTIDDKTPYAYEEIWENNSSSNGIIAAGGCNVLGYKNSFSGVNISLEIDPGHSTTSTDTGGCTGDSSNTGNDTNAKGYNWAVTAAPMDGLNIGAGYGVEENNDGVTANVEDEEFKTAFVTYATGPVTVGYQRSKANHGSTADEADQDIDIYGISFNVNENFAISATQLKRESSAVGSTAGVEEKATGFGASYTMGSASIRLQQTDVDNPGLDATAKDEEFTEISLMLAF
jgi:outer membrane protein OmpU